MCCSVLQHVLQQVAQHDMSYGMSYVLQCVGTAHVSCHTCLVLCHTCVAQHDMSYATPHAHHDMKAASRGRDWYIISDVWVCAYAGMVVYHKHTPTHHYTHSRAPHTPAHAQGSWNRSPWLIHKRLKQAGGERRYARGASRQGATR
jgi:hypothetical protein